MKNKKLAIVVLVVGALLIAGGLSVGIYAYINKTNQDNKKIEEAILKDYTIFRENVESFNEFRGDTYYTEVVKDLYPESVESDYENWIEVLNNYTGAVDRIEGSSNSLKEHCVNKYYSDENIKNKCDSFVIAYETAINYYTKDIMDFNETIETYLNQVESPLDNVKTYELKYNYTDINSDGNFVGRD